MAGRRAGVGQSAIVMRVTRVERRPRLAAAAKIASAKSARVASPDPVMWCCGASGIGPAGLRRLSLPQMKP